MYLRGGGWGGLPAAEDVDVAQEAANVPRWVAGEALGPSAPLFHPSAPTRFPVSCASGAWDACG